MLPHEISHSFYEVVNHRKKFWNILNRKRGSGVISDVELLQQRRSERNSHSYSQMNNNSKRLSQHIDGICDEALVCQICLEPYSVGDKVAVSKYNRSCDHIFHQKCITAWLRRSNTCPCCRHPYINLQSKENDARENVFKKFCMPASSDDDELEPCQFCQIHGIIDPSAASQEKDTENLDLSNTISSVSNQNETSNDLDDAKTISIRSTADLNV